MQEHNAIIVTVGDELLIGQVIDTNSAWIGEQLNLLGVNVLEKLAISDTKKGILDALLYATKKADIVLFTGGLGPTKDDITKDVIAEYYKDEMVFHTPTHQRILKLFERWGRPSTEAHRLQCYMPSSAMILENRMGTAPGMLFQKDDHTLISMPGVPYEMKYLMESHVLAMLKERFIGKYIIHKTLQTAGEGESRIADRIDHIVSRLPNHIKLAYLPNLGKVRLRLTAEGNDETQLNTELEEYTQSLANELGDLVFGYGNENLVNAIGKICLEKNLTIGTAESCTGGKVASLIVNEEGSSAFFQGSLITYSNELKMKLLGVKAETLESLGAVSEQTVKEMVEGALDHLDVDVVIAISGIAGPTGGSEAKPIGTIWMACGSKDRVRTKLIKAGKNRDKNIEYAANYALDLLRHFLKEI